MRTRNRLADALLLLLVLLVIMVPPASHGSPAGEPDPSLAAFFGRWEGAGRIEGGDDLFLAVAQRELYVRIEPTADGFSIAWSTLTRTGGTAETPEWKARATREQFRPGDRPGLFVGTASADPLTGGTMTWARLAGNRLSIYQLGLNEEAGFDLTSYDRTVAQDRMDLLFRRLRDGELVRTVRARLIRVED